MDLFNKAIYGRFYLVFHFHGFHDRQGLVFPDLLVLFDINFDDLSGHRSFHDKLILLRPLYTRMRTPAFTCGFLNSKIMTLKIDMPFIVVFDQIDTERFIVYQYGNNTRGDVLDVGFMGQIIICDHIPALFFFKADLLQDIIDQEFVIHFSSLLPSAISPVSAMVKGQHPCPLKPGGQKIWIGCRMPRLEQQSCGPPLPSLFLPIGQNIFR